VKVPPALRRYFERMGGGAPGFLTGTDTHLPVLAARTGDARAMLRESGLNLDDDAVVITSHQGYDVAWVRASLGDESPVFGYLEGASAIEKRFPSFGLWLLWALQQP